MNNQIGPFIITNDFVAGPIKIAGSTNEVDNKLFLESDEYETELDEFFNNYTKENRYYFMKDNLVDYLKYAKFEYLNEVCNKYQEVDYNYYLRNLERVEGFQEIETFNIHKIVNSGGYYIASDGNKIFDFVLREMVLPDITSLTINKDGSDFYYNIDIDFSLTNNQIKGRSTNPVAGSRYDLYTAYYRYLLTVGYKESSAYKHALSLKSKSWTDLFDGNQPLDTYSTYDADVFSDTVNKIKNSSKNYKEKNPNTLRQLNKAMDRYIEFLKSYNMPYQLIFFGAPGTGKSYQLNKLSKDKFNNNIERVTFHPNYIYGNFVGTYKPFVKPSSIPGSEEVLTYTFVPGPLIRVLTEAYKNPNQNYLLIIEEINRANVSAVFGDTFQLLDRNKHGYSEYKISSSEEVRNYLKLALSNEDGKIELDKKVTEELGESFEYLYFPSNFYLWATMNSADQGVMPMDTAFKRRWEFEYIGIDDGVTSDFLSYKFRVGPNTLVSWNEFRKAVNKRLEKHIPEDKLLGPYFIPEAVLKSGAEYLTEAVRDKVLIYLYDDAAKPFRNQIFVPEKSIKFSDLRAEFDKDALGIFKDRIDIPVEKIRDETDEENPDEEAVSSDDRDQLSPANPAISPDIE